MQALPLAVLVLMRTVKPEMSPENAMNDADREWAAKLQIAALQRHQRMMQAIADKYGAEALHGAPVVNGVTGYSKTITSSQ